MPNDGGPKRLNKNETEAVKDLFQWASQLALPSSAFAAAFDEHVEVTKGKKNPGYESLP
jgi:hypothetical protein